MLNAMRSGAGGFVAKLLLALLILSFSVWGIEDMIRYGGQSRELASVAGREISRASFERAYRYQADAMRAQLGKNYSPELLKMLRIENKVLQDMITAEMLNLEAHELGLIPPDEAVIQELRAVFKNEKGAFDKNLFVNALRQRSITEKAFVADLKRQMATRTLLQGIGASAPLNRVMARSYYEASKEERVADIAVLAPTAKDVPAPSDAEIEKFYTSHKDAFMRPEYRGVSYLTVSTDELLKGFSITEEELKAAYDEKAALFGDAAEPYAKVKSALEKELKRGKMDEAVSAFSVKLEDAIAGSGSLQEAAKELHLSSGRAGPFDREGKNLNGEKVSLPEYPNFLETAFKVEEGRESALIPAREGTYYMLRVERVQSESAPPLEDVREKIVEAWKKSEAAKHAAAEAGVIAKEMLASETPAAVASKHRLSITSSGAVRRGDQKNSSGMPLPAALVAEIFAANVGSATKAYPGTEGRQLIAIVRERRLPPRTTPEALEKDGEFKLAKEQLETNLREQLLEEYLAHLRTKYHVTINTEALDAYSADQP